LLQQASNNIETIVLEIGVDAYEHNLEDENGEKVELNYDLWMQIANEKLLKFVVDEIRTFSQGFSLGESKSKELSTP
jgi:hypothetical protein